MPWKTKRRAPNPCSHNQHVCRKRYIRTYRLGEDVEDTVEVNFSVGVDDVETFREHPDLTNRRQ